MTNVAVIGLGYVGLPLALLADKKGFNVVGFDKDSSKVSSLQKNECVIDDVASKRQLPKSHVNFTDNIDDLRNSDIAIICVPTPVNEDKSPNLEIVKSASVETAKVMKSGSLLVIESTINPGVCDEVLIPAIEESTEHKIGKTLGVAHCPERINPGDQKWHVGNINRVLGADSADTLKKASSFYEELVDAEIKKMGSLKEAEAVKVVENSFRDINIAFVNELAMSFSMLGINVVNVIDGAATKPFAFMPHYPGIGVGGHCIPVDPYYLIEYAKGKGFDHIFLSLARNLNENMPIYAIDAIEQALIKKGEGDIKGKRVAILGLAYKPNVSDDRESPSYTLIKVLEQRGSIVSKFDPHILSKSTHKSMIGAITDADVVILCTKHDEFSSLQAETLAHVSIFFDGRNCLANLKDELQKHNTTYLGIGIQ